MAPRIDETTIISTQSPKTVIMRPKDQPEYIVCDSPDAYMNPTAQAGVTAPTAGEINDTLNLNLGQTFITPENKKLIRLIHFLNRILLFWWEHRLFQFLERVPLIWRRRVTFAAWNIYFPIHKYLVSSARVVPVPV
jgi:hypothetical protein